MNTALTQLHHHTTARAGAVARSKESFSLRVSPALHPPERPSPRRADMAGHGIGRETRERRYICIAFVMYITTNMCDGVLHCLWFVFNVFLVSLHGD